MKIEYRRINHVTLAMPGGEHEKVRVFYGSVLGLKEVKLPDALNKVYDLIWYEWLDILLHIDFAPPWGLLLQSACCHNSQTGISICRWKRASSPP